MRGLFLLFHHLIPSGTASWSTPSVSLYFCIFHIWLSSIGLIILFYLGTCQQLCKSDLKRHDSQRLSTNVTRNLGLCNYSSTNTQRAHWQGSSWENYSLRLSNLLRYFFSMVTINYQHSTGCLAIMAGCIVSMLNSYKSIKLQIQRAQI